MQLPCLTCAPRGLTAGIKIPYRESPANQQTSKPASRGPRIARELLAQHPSSPGKGSGLTPQAHAV